jgi:hypothetical protein
MRKSCADLTEAVIDTGHWMAQEHPVAVNQAIAKFIFRKVKGLAP